MGALTTPLNDLLESLSRCFDTESAQRLTEFSIDPTVQSRVNVLAERANEGMLSEDERTEYEAFVNAADFISILKLKAGRRLKSNRA